MVNSFVAFIAVFSAVVLVHELGHFLAARRSGVACAFSWRAYRAPAQN